jgi:hypothetical protein
VTLCRWKWTQTFHLSTNLQVCCGCRPPSDITPNLCQSCRYSPSPLPLPLSPPLPSLCCCRPLPSPFKPTLSIGRMSKSLTKSLMKWEKSNGKKMLKKELWDINSHFQSMNIKDIHSSDACLSVYPLKNFTTNYKNLKKNVNGLTAQVDFNNLAVSQHKKSYPSLSHTKQGYPHWNDHPEKQHLEDDVYNGIADTMIPSQLSMTHRSYQDFPPDIFCVRVHAEKRKQREQTFWVAKRNETAMKQHLKEAADMRKNRE